MQRPSQFAVQLFRRTRDFLLRTEPAVRLGAITPHVEALGKIADRLAEVVIEQDTRGRQGRAGSVSIRRHLRSLKLEYMRPVTRAARAMFPDDAALLAALRIPGRVRRPEEAVAAAHAMANAVEPHAARFVANGLPADFVALLRGAAGEVVTAIDRRAADVARRTASAAAVRAEVSRGRALMAFIDSLVRLRLESSPELAAEWRSLMRQGRLRRPAVEPAEGADGGVKDGSGEGVLAMPVTALPEIRVEEPGAVEEVKRAA